MCLCMRGSNPVTDSPNERSTEAQPLKGETNAARGSRNSARSEGADSGVGHESPVLRYLTFIFNFKRCNNFIIYCSRKTSVETHPNFNEVHQHSNQTEAVYSFSVEECILQSHANRHVHCPVHNDIHLAQVAPDTVRSFFFLLKTNVLFRYFFSHNRCSWILESEILSADRI